MTPRLKIAGLVVLLALCAVLVWAGLTGRTRERILPEGPQTLTGTLIPAELSLTRRGTHVLKVQDENVAYVESPSVNLRLYELTNVGVTGSFQLNTDPADLPVLVVTSVRAVEIPAASVELPSVGLTLRVPSEWTVEQYDDGAAFTLTGSSAPILRVLRSSLTRLPQGAPMFIGGYDAVRLDDGNGDQTVHLQAGRTIVTFTWTPHDDESLAPAFAQMLRTAVVRSVAASSQRSQTGATASATSTLPASSAGAAGSAGSAAYGQPCGGPAGVLCPSGSFCAVTDPDGVGTCRPL